MAGILDPKTSLLTQAPVGTTINESGVVSRPIQQPTLQPQTIQAIQSPDLRSVISDTQKPGYIQGYDTNQNYKPVFVPKGQYVPGISATPKQITTDSLKTGSNVKLPGITDINTSEASSLVAGASQNIASLVEQLTPPETNAGKQQQTILDQIAGLTSEQGNMSTDQLAAEEQAGIPQLRTQLASINGDIQTKLAEYKVLETENQNKPITMNSIIGNERAILNAKASDIGLLQARANALSGNIEAAQQNVDRAIGLKYQTIEARLNTYQAQLNALMPTLNKEEKIQALAQQTLLDKQKQEIADKKQSEKEQTSYLIDLMTKYPDAKIGLSDSIASAQSKVSGSKIYQDQVRAPVGSGGGGGGIGIGVGTGADGGLTDYSILAEAVSNSLGSVAAKNSFTKQYNQAKTDEERLKILAANAKIPTEAKNGIIQNSQVVRSINDVFSLLDSGAKTGLLQAGQSYIANKLGTGGDKQVEAIKSKLVSALQPYRNKVTGAAWGPQEEAEYQSLIGSVRFTPEDLRNKLNVFKQTLISQSQAAIMAGIDPLGAINQDSILNSQPALTAPTLPNSTPNNNQTSSGGFFSRAWNWLFED